MRFETVSVLLELRLWLASRGLAHSILLFHSGSHVDRVRSELSARALAGERRISHNKIK